MKVYKSRDLSLMLKPYGIAGRQVLAVTVFACFDLTAPDDLLGEQDMWRDIPGQLGDSGVLDPGFAKNRPEVLADGSCFAPRGTRRNASRVRVPDGVSAGTRASSSGKTAAPGAIGPATAARAASTRWRSAARSDSSRNCTVRSGNSAR